MASHDNHKTKPTTITILIAISSFISAVANTQFGDPSAAARLRDALKSSGLPIGLFPNGITDFSLDSASGRFELRFLYPSTCDAQFESHVRFQCNITGRIGYGRIGNLSGVAAQELFLWLPVKGINVDVPSSGLIYFDVGVFLKQFPLSYFEAPKDCNALKAGDWGGDDVVALIDHRDRNRIAENDLEKLVREGGTDEGQVEVS